MAEGTVKWFNPRKGYGFISTGDGRDIFVHYANITGEGYKTLTEGDAVIFDIVKGEKGLRAENVVQKSTSESKPVQQTNDGFKIAYSIKLGENLIAVIAQFFIYANYLLKFLLENYQPFCYLLWLIV